MVSAVSNAALLHQPLPYIPTSDPDDLAALHGGRATGITRWQIRPSTASTDSTLPSRQPPCRKGTPAITDVPRVRRGRTVQAEARWFTRSSPRPLSESASGYANVGLP